MYNTYKNPEVTLKSRRKECSPRKRCQPCMKLTDMAGLCSGSVVWARLGQSWWPGTVTTLDKCPTEYVQSLNEMKKMPIAIVKFFNENEFQDIHKEEHISVYNCDRKEEFIRKGQSANKNQTHDGVDLLKKFEADVVTAEKLTGGDMSIIENMRGGSGNKRRIDYSDLGFGDGNVNKPKKRGKPDENGNSRKRASDIGEVICYKKGTGRSKGNINGKRMVVQHTVKIMEQKRPDDISADMRNSSNIFKCYTCGYSCSRLNVIIWHNKGHMNKVANYDSGIKIPGRRKRKTGPRKKKENKGKENINSHAQTNGVVESPQKESEETQALLMDWEDEEDEEVQEVAAQENGGSNVICSDDDDDDNGDYPPPQPRYERQPMPKADDINSAFDALLAATPASTYSGTNSQNSSKYINNDSDSECSDWDKWLAKDSATSDEEDEELESDIKSLCEDKDEPVDNGEIEEETSKDTDVSDKAFLGLPNKMEMKITTSTDESSSKEILGSVSSREAPLHVPEYSSQKKCLKVSDDVTPQPSPGPLVLTESALSIRKEEEPELQVQALDLTQDLDDKTKETMVIQENLREDMIEDIYEISGTSKSSISQDSSVQSYDAYQNREDTDPMEEDYKYNMSAESLQQVYKQSTPANSSITTETQILKNSASILQETDDYASMLSHLEEEMQEEKVKPKETVTREDSESSSPQIIDDSPEESGDLQIMDEERESSEEKHMVYPIEEDSRDLQITEEVTRESVQERTLPYSSVTYQVSSDDDDDVVQVQSSPEEPIPVDEDGYRSRICENAGVGILPEGTRHLSTSSSSRYEGYDMSYRRHEYDYSSESEAIKQDIHESVEDSEGDSQAAPTSGTTYMLVAVDAHGNTVPTPALSQGGNNLMAVEATMEGGTTRTLYIDPSQLGPNVDLNNMMLHIDTSGQEHVIIPSSSSSDSEPSYEQTAYYGNAEST